MSAGTDVRTWYHTIDLPHGGHTEGWYDCRPITDSVAWPEMAGRRCLDVGTFDGFWAFEMERRGAIEVVAIDVDDPSALDWFYDERQRGPELVVEWGTERGPGFVDAVALVGSSATRVDCSVYDLSVDVAGTFDVVFCGALLLHLADPVSALERMREVCTGDLVLVEHLDPYLDLVAPRRPGARFGADWDQWWRPNSAALVKLVERAGFDITALSPRFLLPYGPAAPRYGWRATALHALAARQPTRRGLLFRSLRATPRRPRPRR
jgi:tRNA (mo5U34)-methyltransferase